MSVVVLDDDILERVHPAFTIFDANDETPNEEIKCILNFEKSKVQVTSKLISAEGKGSGVYARRFSQKVDDQRQICLLCQQIIKGTTLWNARSHLIYNHQMFCEYKELCQHNQRWILEVQDAWEMARKTAETPERTAGGKRNSIADHFSPLQTSSNEQLELCRLLAVVICRGMLSFNFVNNPGKKSY